MATMLEGFVGRSALISLIQNFQTLALGFDADARQLGVHSVSGLLFDQAGDCVTVLRASLQLVHPAASGT